MDTLIFLAIFGTLLTMRAGKRRLALALFAISLAATLLLFNHHVTSRLNLKF